MGVVNKPNPHYIEAPYEVSFAILVIVPAAVRLWSRKRRLKWIRRERKKVVARYVVPPVPFFNQQDQNRMGELEWSYVSNAERWCLCKGDPNFHGHDADCAYATGN